MLKLLEIDQTEKYGYVNSYNLASEFKIDVSGVTKISLLYNELLPYKDKAIEQL